MNSSWTSIWSALLIACGLAVAMLPAEEPVPDGRSAKDMITTETQKVIDNGLAFLARNQAEDGSWGDRAYLGNVAVTSLCGLAFMAGGHQPDRGPYGTVVTKALRYVLSKESQQTPGYLYHPGGNSQGPMYSHGFGALLLAEAHGMVPDKALAKRLRETLDRSVQLILSCQNNEGGWRYRPIKEQADISVTVCQIMALRSARNAGLQVPKGVAEKCIEYVKACQVRGPGQIDGGFRYFKQGGAPAFARSAAGLSALYCAGVYQGEEITRGLKYLAQFRPGRPGARRDPNDIHYYYGHYYAVQAMWTAGEPYWSEWFPAIRDDLVNRSRQRPDGIWHDPNVCTEYATAMACIILQVPNNYLPIMQK